MMTVVIDTREQLEYAFSAPSVRRKLEAGDYSVEGFEDRVAVERKSMADFVSTVIRGRKRFHKELQKLRHYEAACVVVEGNFRDLLEGRYLSDVHPNALAGSIASIIIDFGVPVYFCSDRQAACLFTETYLSRFHRRVAPCQEKETPRSNSGDV
jgi:ERCC4-type nuclease